MSPIIDGANVTSPAPLTAVNVFWKKDSLVSILRASAPSRPPCIFVSMSTVALIDTMAPDSALTASPRASATRAQANAGPCSRTTCMGTLRSRKGDGSRRDAPDPTMIAARRRRDRSVGPRRGEPTA